MDNISNNVEQLALYARSLREGFLDLGGSQERKSGLLEFSQRLTMMDTYDLSTVGKKLCADLDDSGNYTSVDSRERQDVKKLLEIVADVALLEDTIGKIDGSSFKELEMLRKTIFHQAGLMFDAVIGSAVSTAKDYSHQSPRLPELIHQFMNNLIKDTGESLADFFNDETNPIHQFYRKIYDRIGYPVPGELQPGLPQPTSV